MNVHSFDGCLTSVPHNDVDKASLEPLRAIEPNDIMEVLLNDLGTPANFDSSNNIWADDLLVLCLPHLDNPDFREAMTEQLNDMRTGFCPQGRTHRLYQLVKAFPPGTNR